MHIVMITDYYLPTLGGIQTSVKAQKYALEKAGHKVTIICPGRTPSGDPTIIHVPTFRHIHPDGFPVAGPTNAVIQSITGYLQLLQPIDVVHVHSDMVCGLSGLVVAKRLNIPTVQSMHGREDVYVQKILPLPAVTSYFLAKLHSAHISHAKAAINTHAKHARTITARRIWRLMVSHVNYADTAIIPSCHFAQKLTEHGMTIPHAIVSNGLEDPVLAMIGKPKLHQYTGRTPLQIIWCARFSPEKRPLQFLKAIRYIKGPVNVHFYGDGLLTRKMQRYINHHGLNSIVTIHGPVPQAKVLAAMRTADLFVSTSYDFDNQPMVFLEAIATGLPVCIVDPELGEVFPEKGYFVTATPHPRDIAQSIQTIIDAPSQIAAVSRKLLQHQEAVSQQNQTAALVTVYKQAIRACQSATI